MAEVITAVGLAASVAQLIGITAKVYKYLNDVKNAPKERSSLSLEAANLLPLLNSLRDQVENATPNDPWIESVLELGGPAGPLELFKRTMEQLKRKLKVESPMLRMGKYLVWTLDKDEIRRILADIERFKTRLGLALQNDNFRLSRAIKEDTAGIQPINGNIAEIKTHTAGITPLHQDVSAIRTDTAIILPIRENVNLISDNIPSINRNIADIKTHTTGIAPLHQDVSAIRTDTAAILPMRERVNHISDNVDSLHANYNAQADASLVKNVLAWISPFDFQKNHASAAEARIDGTGQWFLDCTDFRRWRDSNNETLYCQGIPGAGKTVMASLVIDHLYTEYMNEDTAVIYAYCYYKERSQQSLISLLGGLLKQLLSLRNPTSADFKALHEAYQRHHRSGILNEISSLFRAELRRYRKVFIIVDALDEYSDNQEDCELMLAELEQLREYSNIMLTSRFVTPYINAFRGASRVTITAKDRDVRKYLESQIATLPRFVKANLELQELIIETITEAVEGMFLLASLHMQSLKDKISIRKVKEALTRLPRGSGSAASKIAYDETMNRIRGQEKGFCDLAMATLAWISLAMTPLTLRELQCALSVEPGDTEMDEANFVDEETLSSVCAGLIVVDHESQIVRLAHYTTQEYFESRENVLFPDKQNLLAETCLTYLSFNVFSNPRFKDTFDFYPYPRTYPLLNYAAHHWHEHAHLSHGSTIPRLIIEFLERTESLRALFYNFYFMEMEYNKVPLQESFSRQSFHGLPIAARHGFTDAVKALLHLKGYCAEDRNRIKAQALCLAAFYRHLSAVHILLEGNTIAPAAVSRALSNMYTPAIAAPGGCEVAQILLNHGADPNTALNDIPLIHHACRSNDVQLASLLLSSGADVDLRDDDGRTVLHGVAERGYSGDIVELFLEYNVDINTRDDYGETALLTALEVRSPEQQKGRRSLITQLLGCGASADKSDIHGWTALHLAAYYGALQIACQLLEAGADAGARNHAGKTAAGCLYEWEWGSTKEEERAEYEEILERYSFYESERKSSLSDSDEDLDSDEFIFPCCSSLF